MDNDANAFTKHTCHTILMAADTEPEKRHKNQNTLPIPHARRNTDEHDRMKCENLRTPRTRAPTITLTSMHSVLKHRYNVCAFVASPFKMLRNLNHVDVCLHAKWY